MDAVQAWPFEAGSAQAVNSEHFIEHVEPEEAAAYLREAFRVIRPGGVIRTSTPDLGAICRAYLDRDAAMLEAHRNRGYVARTHAEMLNTYIRMGGLHKYAYDEDTLRLLLGEAGFEEIERAAFGESRHAVLRGIDHHSMAPLQHFAVCLDAVKPPLHG
jgi:predicted SAM-dependent methyltransferase